ncbi:MAG: hypothetical protein ACRDM1_09150 [Gaiellaceae bacterium]
MDPPDDDIQFDFFEDEPPTTEAQGPRVRLPRRAGRGTGGRGAAGPPRGFAPVLRLLALIAVVVAVLVFFGLVIQSCASTSKHDEYSSYAARVATIAHSSADDGAAVATALITPGAKPNDLAGKLRGVAEQERQNVAAAQHVSVPGRLRAEHQQLIEALELRVSGVQGLAETFAANPKSTSDTESSVLSQQADRLLASDVVWDDLFLAPATQELKNQGVSGVVLPESHFVANRELATERSMSQLLTRLRGTTGGGTPTGIHGTNIEAVKVLPGGKPLSASSDNTVLGSTDTAFVVSIKDSGDFQEVGIKVSLTIAKTTGGKPIVKNKVLPIIDKGQTKTVTFSDFGELPFGYKANVSVAVATVPGEHNSSNNKATYPVFFSLGG